MVCSVLLIISLWHLNSLLRVVMNPKSTSLLICILVIITACATPNAHGVDPQLPSRSNLSFIKEGLTTCEEVLTRLGKPSAQYENQRILTYRLKKDSHDNRFISLTPMVPETTSTPLDHYDVFDVWGDPSTYSLVLVFGPDGKLRKHNLVGFR